MLDNKSAFYLVDNLKIYTWKGKECPKELRKKILVGIDEFLSAIGFKVTAGRDSSATSTLFSRARDGYQLNSGVTYLHIQQILRANHK